MAKKTMAHYVAGTIVRKGDRIDLLKIHTAETSPGKLLPTAEDYCRAYKEKLGKFGHIDHLRVIINSTGGSFYSAAGIQQAIHEMTRGRKPQIGRISILIDGACSSAATYVAFGQYENEAVFITPGSRVFIHMPRVYEYTRTGGIWEVIKKAGTLITKRAFVELYQRRTGEKRWKIRSWMREGHTFTAEEAVEMGFCDAIMKRADFERLGG